MNDPVRDALAELVELKDLKERIKHLAHDGYEATLTDGDPSWGEHDAVMAEYMRRKNIAWTAARTALAALPAPAQPFQARVQPWMLACFGVEIAADKQERNHRFLEESLELVQACGATASEAHQLVDYVYGRPVGEPKQEAGGVAVTLAALCLAQGLDMHDAGETELARIWTKVDVIRAKQAAKPKHSPLPAPAEETAMRALKAVVAHWTEFGPEHGFDECVDRASLVLAAPLPVEPAAAAEQAKTGGEA